MVHSSIGNFGSKKSEQSRFQAFPNRFVAVTGCVLASSAGLSLPSRGAEMDGFKVGASQIDISTRDVMAMGGYGTYFLKTPRLNQAGVHDPLLASAVAFESVSGQKAAVVVLDVVGLSAAQISRIEQAARQAVDPRLSLIISATHTHHSPDTLGLWGSLPKSGRNKRYAEQIETAALQAVRDAFARLEPARVTQRLGRHANSTSALTNPQEVQDAFTSLAFYSTRDDHLIGTLTQWAAHPTVLGMENNALSSDFVGGFRRSMERLIGPGPHVYVNGIMGKVYPNVPPEGDPDVVDDLFPEGDRDPDVKDGYRKASTVGFRLAQSVARASEEAGEFSSAGVAVCHVPVAFPVDNKLFKLASSLKVVETRVKGGKIGSRVSTLSVGNLVFTSIPGEVFPKVVRNLDSAVFAGRQTVWMGLGQDWLGYFVDPEDYEKPDLKYWTDLSVHRDGAPVLLSALDKALRGEGCKNMQPIEPPEDESAD
jgi:hypothetical protein